MGLIHLISPAKTLDFSDHRADIYTEPRLLTQTKRLVRILKKKNAADLMALMSISEKLGTLNFERYQNFSKDFNEENAKQAILAFKGDVYLGLEAESMNDQELNYAQDHLRILSGLYGLLRPLDLMQPYRLEMGTKLENKNGKDLYAFWGDDITKLLNRDLKENGCDTLVNLASKEYFKAINTKKLNARLVDIDFKENRDGVYKVISFNAKKARGTMSRLIIQNQIETVDGLKALEIDGYRYSEDLSSEDHLLFVK